MVRWFVHSFIQFFIHLLILLLFIYVFFFFKFSQQDTSTPTQRPVETETLLKPPQTGDRSASATSVTATEEPRSEVILHVSRSISPPSFKWFTVQQTQPGPLEISLANDGLRSQWRLLFEIVYGPSWVPSLHCNNRWIAQSVNDLDN